MRKYQQLSYEERVKIAELWQWKTQVSHIAKALGRHKSTISRELRRNGTTAGHYWPDGAQGQTLRRCRRGSILDGDEELKTFVLNQLRCHFWSPEQIAGYLKHRQKALVCVSHETIYAFIYRAEQRKEKLWKYLARHKAKRGLRKSRGIKGSRIPDRVSIHHRPKEVENKGNFGHWEGDLMSFRKNTGHILVLRERKTMFLQSAPLNRKTADLTAEKLVALMKKLPKKARKTLTLDNGGEFAAHSKWRKPLGIKTYFCDPYASWQKGGVENTNGRLRRDLPRNTNIHAMQEEDFLETIHNYNTTPRKSLGWLTPLEAFNKNLQTVALHT